MRICTQRRLEEGSFSEFHKYLQYLSFLVLSSLVFLASYLFIVHIYKATQRQLEIIKELLSMLDPMSCNCRYCSKQGETRLVLYDAEEAQDINLLTILVSEIDRCVSWCSWYLRLIHVYLRKQESQQRHQRQTSQELFRQRRQMDQDFFRHRDTGASIQAELPCLSSFAHLAKVTVDLRNNASYVVRMNLMFTWGGLMDLVFPLFLSAQRSAQGTATH